LLAVTGENHDKFTESHPPGFIDNDMPHRMNLMKQAHDVLKDSIQLFETLQWMERAVKLLIQAGSKLDSRLMEIKNLKSQKISGSNNDNNLEDKLSRSSDASFEDDLSYYGSEIRQGCKHLGQIRLGFITPPYDPRFCYIIRPFPKIIRESCISAKPLMI
jgi:hypothetical protein